MRKNRVTQRDILFLSLSLFILVTVWVAFNLYHAWVTSTISSDLQIQIIPIEPNFDTDTLHTLESRKKIVPLFSSPTEQASESATISPIPTPSLAPQPPTPTASISAAIPTRTTPPTITPTGVSGNGL